MGEGINGGWLTDVRRRELVMAARLHLRRAWWTLAALERAMPADAHSATVRRRVRHYNRLWRIYQARRAQR